MSAQPVPRIYPFAGQCVLQYALYRSEVSGDVLQLTCVAYEDKSEIDLGIALGERKAVTCESRKRVGDASVYSGGGDGGESVGRWKESIRV